MRPSELFAEKTGCTSLYNIQAIENIPSIMYYGLLSNHRAKSIEHTSIAMNEVQIRRDIKRVPNGLNLHQYANLYFDARNPMLSVRRNQNNNICILKIDKVVLDFKGVVVSDRNASSAYASFYPPETGFERINFSEVYAEWWTDDDYYEKMRKKSVKCAEVLVPYEIPYRYIVGATVINEVAKTKLKAVGFDKPIMIEPRMFF